MEKTKHLTLEDRSKRTSLSSFSIDSILTSKCTGSVETKSANLTPKCSYTEQNKMCATDLIKNNHAPEETPTCTTNNYFSAMFPTVNVPFAEYYLERLNRLRGNPVPFRYAGSGYMGPYMTEEAKRYLQSRYGTLPPGFQTFSMPESDSGNVDRSISKAGDFNLKMAYKSLAASSAENESSDIDLDENDSDVVDDASEETNRNTINRERGEPPDNDDSSLEDDDNEDINNDDSDLSEGVEENNSGIKNERLYNKSQAWPDKNENAATTCLLNKKNKRKLGKVIQIHF